MSHAAMTSMEGVLTALEHQEPDPLLDLALHGARNPGLGIRQHLLSDNHGTIPLQAPGPALIAFFEPVRRLARYPLANGEG